MKKRKFLPFVYVNSEGEMVVSDHIIEDRPISEIRGLMISKTLEMEIRSEYMNYVDSKIKAINNKAELLSINDKKIYKKSYTRFNDTIWYIIENGYSLSYTTSAPDGFWCEEICKEASPWTVFHYTVDTKTGKVSGKAVIGYSHCRLIHRHEAPKSFIKKMKELLSNYL